MDGWALGAPLHPFLPFLRGMLPLNSALGLDFLFPWDGKGSRLLSRSEEDWRVGGWAPGGAGVRFLTVPAGGIPAKEEAGSELRKLSPDCVGGPAGRRAAVS